MFVSILLHNYCKIILRSKGIPMKNVYLFLADGTEECEALVTLDLLRRAGIDVTTISVMDSRTIKSSSGVSIETDVMIEGVNLNEADMLILPGGMPGTLHLGECQELCDAILVFNQSDKKIAAICAAPSVLGKLGVLEGKSAICYPGFEDELTGATIAKTDPVTDGNITTASGLGHVIPFALEIIKVLESAEKANEVAAQIGYK